jgi:hypothetical protein
MGKDLTIESEFHRGVDEKLPTAPEIEGDVREALATSAGDEGDVRGKGSSRRRRRHRSPIHRLPSERVDSPSLDCAGTGPVLQQPITGTPNEDEPV